MEVILLEKMRNLGRLGDKVKVKPGYARNFLIPQGKAVFASKDNLQKFEERRAELEKKAADKMKEAEARQVALNELQPITLAAKAGEEGKLFGSITTRDIADEISKTGIEVEKREVRLPEGSIRLVGEYEVTLDLEGDLTATIKLNVVPE